VSIHKGGFAELLDVREKLGSGDGLSGGQPAQGDNFPLASEARGTE